MIADVSSALSRHQNLLRRFLVLTLVLLLISSPVTIGDVNARGAETATEQSITSQPVLDTEVANNSSSGLNRTIIESQTQHGVNNTTYEVLWSHDADNLTWYRNSSSTNESIARTYDYVWVTPPSISQKWNAEEILEFNQSSNNSRYPTGETIEFRSSGDIQSAYVEIASVSPSTVVHSSPREDLGTQMMVRGEGTVYATTDHYVNKSITGSFGGTESSSAATSGNVESVVLKGKTPSSTYVAGTGESTDGVVTVDYENLNHNTEDLVLEVEITNGGDSVTVSDSISVVTPNKDVKATVAKMPDDSMQTQINPGKRAWGRVELPNEKSVYNGWHYYTTRDPGWDTMSGAREGDGKQFENSSVWPLQVHAFPQEDGVYTSDYTKTNVVDSNGTQFETPPLQENVNVTKANESYEYPSTLIVSYSEYNEDLDGFSVYGVVDGQKWNSDEIEIERRVQVKDPQFNISVVDRDREQRKSKVRVTLKDPDTGEGISTLEEEIESSAGGFRKGDGSSSTAVDDNDPSHVTVNGKKIEMTDGTKEVWINHSSDNVIQAEYHAQDWWDVPEGETPYIDDNAIDTVRNDSQGWFERVTETLFYMLSIILPILFLHGVWVYVRRTWEW